MSAPATSIRQLALADLDQELAGTRSVLERVPEEHLSWNPHAKSFTLGELATHVANLPYWLSHTVEGDFFDVAVPMPRMEAAPSRDALLATFDERVATLRAALDGADDEALSQPWELRAGEKVSFRAPKFAVLRGFGLNHIIHHRGQLTVYLRLLDVPLPPLYGPTADERPQF